MGNVQTMSAQRVPNVIDAWIYKSRILVFLLTAILTVETVKRHVLSVETAMFLFRTRPKSALNFGYGRIDPVGMETAARAQLGVKNEE